MVDKDESFAEGSLQKLSVEQIEHAFAKAIGELAGVEYTARIIELKFEPQRAWRGRADIRLEVERS